ncbi:MAG: P-loop NTPase [Oligoflexia bacterium]|nr:P-loop NTPase [Oligoflexia bacterium]
MAIGGAKGGVGKTIVAVNLALALTQTNLCSCVANDKQGAIRVVIIDADYENANTHILLGISKIEKSIENYFNQEIDLNSLVIETKYKNLRLICGGNNKIELAPAKKKRFLEEIKKIPADFVVIDLAAGMADGMIDLFNLADEKIMVVTPQYTSLQNAYGFIKEAFLQKLKSVPEMVVCLRHVDNDPFRLISALKKLSDDHPLKRRFDLSISEQRFWILANMVQEEKDLSVINGLVKLTKEFFNIDASTLGKIHFSQEIFASVNKTIPFIAFDNQSENSKQLRKIAFILSEYSKS